MAKNFRTLREKMAPEAEKDPHVLPRSIDPRCRLMSCERHAT